MMQKDLKTLQALSTGDKAKKAESLYAHEIARDSCNPTDEFRINIWHSQTAKSAL